MSTISNRGRWNYLLITITALLLALIITTTVVLLNKQKQTNAFDPSNNQSLNPAEPSVPSSIPSNNPVPNQNGQICSNPRIRKSWTELSNEEKSRFLNAVTQIKSKPPQTSSATNRYEDFVLTHDLYKSRAHNISAFLPWHRHFINEFEKELQLIDSSITLPFWDWASDSSNPAASSVLANDAFGGDGDPQTGCVRDGAFANWQTSYPSNHCLQRQFDGGRSVIQGWSSPAQVAALVFRFTDYAQFRSAFESTPHAAIHNGIGGDMRQFFSPNDPLFWLHHSNVDRYFLAWQLEHPQSPYNGGSLNDMMAPFNIPISSAFRIPNNSEYCYTYSLGSDSMRRSLSKRDTLNSKNKELKCPPHIPDEFTLSMGCSVEHVRMTEKIICDFTQKFNKKRYLTQETKLSISEEDSNHISTRIWRYHSGIERNMILDSLNEID